MAGIWDHTYLKNSEIPQAQRFSLGEGFTPIIKLNYNRQEVVVKNEYANPNSSFKDRCLAYQISYHYYTGARRFVISSSGNAAISAAAFAVKAGVDLTAFVSPKINTEKLSKLKKIAGRNIEIKQSLRAKSDAMQFAREKSAVNLRASQDESAIVGYKSIAYELVEQFPQIDAIFIPCSSGTSTAGISQGFTELQKKVAVNICQTARVCPIASEIVADTVLAPDSLADAITDHVALRKAQIIKIIKQTQGSAYVISDADLLEAKSKLSGTLAANFTYNSLLAFAAFEQSLRQQRNYQHPVILASGL